MSDEPVDEDLKLREELVAYLDGELDADACQRIERRLAEEPDVRRILQELDRTWRMLDELDSARVPEDFTRTTLEMVAVAASEDAAKLHAEAPRRRRRRWLFAAGGLLAAGAVGFLAVALLAPDPNAQLLQDMPLLEHLDEYRQAGDIDFLRTLSHEKLFTEDIEDE